MPGSDPRQGQAQRAAPGQAQAQKSERGPLTLGGLDDSADQCPPGDALGAGSPGADALSLADRTALETVQRAWPARYLAQLQAGAHPDGDLRQTLGSAHHLLADLDWLLASS